MMLGEQQRVFTKLVSKLIAFAYGRGYELSFGEAYRSDEQAVINALGAGGRVNLSAALRTSGFAELAGAIENNRGSGIKNTLHGNRLAIDLNLFQDGHLLESHANFKVLGDYWKGLHPLCRWGGDFSTPDVFHFSMEWQGVK